MPTTVSPKDQGDEYHYTHRLQEKGVALPCMATWESPGWVRRQRETRTLGQEALLFSAARNKKELQGKWFRIG